MTRKMTGSAKLMLENHQLRLGHNSMQMKIQRLEEALQSAKSSLSRQFDLVAEGRENLALARMNVVRLLGYIDGIRGREPMSASDKDNVYYGPPRSEAARILAMNNEEFDEFLSDCAANDDKRPF